VKIVVMANDRVVFDGEVSESPTQPYQRRYAPEDSIGIRGHRWCPRREVRNGVNGFRGICGGTYQDGRVFNGCGHDHGWAATLPEARDLNQDHLHEVAGRWAAQGALEQDLTHMNLG
jgi:hypothetical protein